MLIISDGTACRNIRFFSSNPSGLKQISNLLNNLNFKHTIQGPIIREKRKPSYIIQISAKDKIKFIQNVDPVSKIPCHWR